MVNISLIASVDLKGRIGVDGDLLFDIPEDKRRFKQITTKTNNPKLVNAVLMGYNTYISIPEKYRPLPGRINIVCTRSHASELASEVEKYPNLYVSKDAIDLVSQIHIDYIGDSNWKTEKWMVHGIDFNSIENLYIIGGEVIYKDLIHYANDVYLCHILSEYSVSDEGSFKYFPMDSLEEYFKLTHTYNYVISKKDNIPFVYKNYSNKNLSEETHYLNALANILIDGKRRETRSGITISKFGINMRFSLRNNTLPLLTTKKMFTRGILEELFWFLRADVDSKHLEDKRVNIWRGNTTREYLDSIGLSKYREGECGPIYGYQWRHFNATYKGPEASYTGSGVDQLKEVIRQIRENPTSRRMIMSAWNPCQLKDMCLPPCHVLYQFYVDDGHLYCSMYQRSGDMFLGIPFNIASTSFLTIMIAHITGLKPGGIFHTIGDAHIYGDHIKQVYKQLSRQPYEFPKCFVLGDVKNIEDFTVENFDIVSYKCHGTIRAKMNV